MSESLYRHYERELVFIRQMASEFATRFPSAAGRLMLEPNRSSDPHVERLIESFAFLTARIQQRLDDDFPEMTDALLSVLYPHFLAPIPSMAVVELQPDPANTQPAGLTIPRHSRMHSQKIRGTACQFRTCYPVTLWPIEIQAARVQTPPFLPALNAPPKTASAIRLNLNCRGDVRFEHLSLSQLRFYLNGDNQLTAELYELIFNHVIQVEFISRSGNNDAESVVLPPHQCLKQVGFDHDEGLLPYPEHAFLGYRLLTELFAFREKFLFFDLAGWEQACSKPIGNQIEIVLYLDRALENLEHEVNAESFRLGCTPIVNLFEKASEPIALTQKKHEYRVLPDVHHPLETEVYSIDKVTSADPNCPREFQPFYCLRHSSAWHPQEENRAFWYASRRPSHRPDDNGSDMYINLVDLDFDPHLPAESALVVRSTCTNRDLPVRLQHLGDSLRFELESAAPLKGVRCLRRPTAPLRPPLRRKAHWRLVSHLALNHLSISDPHAARESLQEMLRLYDFSDQNAGQQLAAVNRQIIDGITAVSSRRAVGRIGGPGDGGFCRGVEVTVELDDQKYLGVGPFLFASVLERFLGLYASVNSFAQLAVRTQQADGYLKRWAPRAGETQLV